MLIKCNIQRPKGTNVEFDGPAGPRSIIYQFRPDADGDHVANVEDEDHIERLLAVPDRVYSLKRSPQKVAQQAATNAVETPPLKPVEQAKEASGAAQPSETAATEKDALVAEYASLFGQAPHPASKIETLRAKIAERKAAQV